MFNQRMLKVQSPNPILEKAEIPKHSPRSLDTPEEAILPSKDRYTPQWLAEPLSAILGVTEHNFNAAFRKNTAKSKPSDLLVHYRYGATAVGRWGVMKWKSCKIENRPNIPRLPALPPVRTTIPGSGQVEKDQAKGGVVLYSWGNLQAALERHGKKQEERAQNLEQWRQAVPPLSIRVLLLYQLHRSLFLRTSL